MVVARIQARGRAGGTVDVGDGTAAATHHVMVVVVHAHLKSRGASGRFDTSNQTGVGERTQHVVDGLRRHLDPGAHCAEKGIDISVWYVTKRVQHGDPRGSYPQPNRTNALGCVGSGKGLAHPSTLFLFWNESRKHQTTAE